MRKLAAVHCRPSARRVLAIAALWTAAIGGRSAAAQWRPLPPTDVATAAAAFSDGQPHSAAPPATHGDVEHGNSPAGTEIFEAPECEMCEWPCYLAAPDEPWRWQWLPSGLIYRSYLAGTKEPRLSSVWTSDDRQGGIWDVTLGGRVGILRYGTGTSARPNGWQLDLEGAAMPRVDPSLPSAPLISTDYRFGIPLTFGYGRWQAKLAFYHVSSHLGDEFMQLNPSFVRINYTRDSGVAGVAFFPTNSIRLYGEAGFAAVAGGAKPIELQFGAEYSPLRPGNAPFAAVNGYLREDVDFGGNVVAQCGWQWRGAGPGHLFRMGLEYYNGKSDQFEFFDQYESRIGGGLWYDY